MIDHPELAARSASRAWLVWTLWIFHWGLLPAAMGDEHVAESLPSWQQGQPRWGGNGYSIPSGPLPEIRTASTTTAAPYYTMPVDPNAPLTPAQNESSSGAIGSGLGTITPPQDSEGLPSLDELQLPEPVHPLPEAATLPEAVTPARDLEFDASPQDLPPPDGDAEKAADAIAAGGEVLESPPLQEEVTRWYQYPVRWMRGWDSHAEFGLDGSDGNANTLAIQTGLELKRKSDAYTLAIDIDYRQANNRGSTTEDNGRFNIDYDRLLGNSSVSGFGKFGMEWDRFKAFDLRLNLNGGIGYYWLRDDTTTLATRFGAGASREIGAPVDEWTPEAVFGLEAERQLTSRQKLKGKIDYFPAFEDFGDYRIVSDISWEILLDGSENLSLKLAATDRYDSTPQGAKPNDVYYSLLLLYKF